MATALPRATPTDHPRLTCDDNARRIVRELRRLPERRDLLDLNELNLIEQARALGWTWDDLAAAYPPSPQTGKGWSVEGVRRRWQILNTRLRDACDGGRP